MDDVIKGHVKTGSFIRTMVDMRDIGLLAQQISDEFNPEKIILFGSYAYGTPGPNPDVDFLVILPFQGKSFRKSLDILNAVSPKFSVDLIVRRPEEVRRRYDCGDPLIREALDKGKVLYERTGFQNPGD